ncbi:hypothetical protein [Thermoplasma sp.]|uniref:hypothetical protein n=1 Tax=Thermoplasma sp. TaxID=1973142 RepID=UPI00126BD502|nr:hypothetical protein [Thermoplasma sp.]KAA8923416.1 MAG: hypothetical protein F6Q11_00200 [Thermoplasma sp.]
MDVTPIIIKVFGYIIEALLVFSIILDVGYAIYDIYLMRMDGLEALSYSLVENAFFALVLLELYLGAHDFVVRSPSGLRHVVEAGLSYIIREIIVDISTGIKDIFSLSALAIVIVSLAVSLYFLSSTEKRRGESGSG